MTDTQAPYVATPRPPRPGEPLFLAPPVPAVVAHGPNGEPCADLVEAGIAVLDAGDNLLATLDRALAGQTMGLLLMYASNEWRRASQAFGTVIDRELNRTEDRQP